MATKIDWPGLSRTINPIVGCANGCIYCYAKRMNDRFKWIPDFTKPQLFPERLSIPATVKKPCTWFVGSVCDIFSQGVPSEWVNLLIKMAIDNPKHTFMFLTKKPENYSKYNWPVNCWLGTTIESKNKTFRLNGLRDMKNMCFVSVEPILSSFESIVFPPNVSLIIVGADSSKGAVIPPLEWVKSIQHPNIWYKQNLRKHYPELINIPSK